MKSLQQLEESKTTLLSVPAEFLSRLPSARWAPIPLRLIVGYGFMEHGFAKLARGPDSFPAILHAIGVPAPHLMAWATILVEIFGGLAILLGAFVVLASYRWPRFYWSRCLRCICPTDSVRSSCRPSPLPARSLGRPAMKLTSCTSRRSRHSPSVALDRCRSMVSFEESLRRIRARSADLIISET
jgi:DoxX